MSIYIQIATLEDTNIVDTVISAFVSATKPEDIHIGIAATVSEGFFNRTIVPLAGLRGVTARRYDPETDRGLGRGRVNSRFAYNGEDYLLQVDAHTYFQKGWDAYITKAYKAAIKETGNDKTLMTCYLGRYWKHGGVKEVLSPWSGYPVYSSDNVQPNVNLKGVAVISIADFPDGQVSNKKKKFYPANRACGNFTMGNLHWAGYQGWTGDEVFWEEETTPSISLLNNGFSLVFPNLPMPITHRYWGEDGIRQVMDDVFPDTSEIETLANAHIAKFIKENPEACAKYAEYSGYDLVTNSLNIDTVIPKAYGL